MVDIFGLTEFKLPKTVKSPGGVNGSFSEKGYTYRIDTNKITQGEGGFHIHVMKDNKEIAKVTGNGGYVKTHKGRNLRKPKELPKSIRKEIRKLVSHSQKKLKSCH